MRRILTIAGSTFRLLFRNGTAWALLASIVAITLFIFNCASADDVLLDELQLRIRYSMGFATVFLSLSMLFVACVAIRHDMSTKMMHVVTSFPVHRYEIWLGKWLGLWFFAALAFLVAAGSTAAAAAYYRANWQRKGGEAALDERFWRCQRECRPDRPSLRDKVDIEYERRAREARLPADRPAWQIRRRLLEELRRDENYLRSGGTKTWRFKLAGRPKTTDYIVLSFTFYAQNTRRQVKGSWTIRAVDAPGEFSTNTSVFPYSRNTVRVPASVVPESGSIDITFAGDDAPDLIFPRRTGVRIFYDDASLAANVARLLLVNLLHQAAVIAVGLTAATAFTFPVASFVSLVLYTLSILSGFFAGVVRDFQWEEPTAFLTAATVCIRVGTWLTGGLALPPVLARFSEGTSIELWGLAQVWGTGFAVYTAIAFGLGIAWLTRKELDKLI